MSEQPDVENRPVTDEPVEPHSQPTAGGSDESEPAQGEGAPDSH